VQTHFGKKAQRGEREVGRDCWSAGIMVIGCVQRDRSEREFRYGRWGMLAKQERGAEALRLVATLIKMRLVGKIVGVVGVREPAWLLKRG
jgi:hypothetical protein